MGRNRTLRRRGSVIKTAMRIVIAGCGRVGSDLAHGLDAEGHTVAVIDIEALSKASGRRSQARHTRKERRSRFDLYHTALEVRIPEVRIVVETTWPRPDLDDTSRGVVVTMRVKIEVDTFEGSPANPPIRIPFHVESSWFSGSAEVLTFTLDEVVATKIRALFQRSKGRDLFDLWLALTQLGVTPPSIVAAFAPYRPDAYTGRRAELNLREKVQRSAFREDIRALVTAWPEGYDIDTAAEFVIADVLALIE